MAYDEELAARIREKLTGQTGLVREKKMFGGVGFIINGNMAVGIHSKNNLLVRFDPADQAEALSKPHTRDFVMRDKAMAGWLVVDAAGLADDATLAHWVKIGSDYAKSLPPK